MLLNYHIGRIVLVLLCVGDLVRLGLSSIQAVGCNTTCASIYSQDTTQAQQNLTSNTQQNKNSTTNVVIQQHRRKVLMMDILMSETC